jgi:hypothetical protein
MCRGTVVAALLIRPTFLPKYPDYRNQESASQAQYGEHGVTLAIMLDTKQIHYLIPGNYRSYMMQQIGHSKQTQRHNKPFTSEPPRSLRFIRILRRSCLLGVLNGAWDSCHCSQISNRISAFYSFIPVSIPSTKEAKQAEYGNDNRSCCSYVVIGGILSPQ